MNNGRPQQEKKNFVKPRPYITFKLKKYLKRKLQKIMSVKQIKIYGHKLTEKVSQSHIRKHSRK